MASPSPQLIERLDQLSEGIRRLAMQMGELERRMLAAEGHLSSFFIAQNRQSAALEQIAKRLAGIEGKLACSAGSTDDK